MSAVQTMIKLTEAGRVAADGWGIKRTVCMRGALPPRLCTVRPPRFSPPRFMMLGCGEREGGGGKGRKRLSAVEKGGGGDAATSKLSWENRKVVNGGKLDKYYRKIGTGRSKIGGTY